MNTIIVKAILGTVIAAAVVIGPATQVFAASPDTLTDNSRTSLFSYITPQTEIDLDQATKIAYNHAGVKKQDVIFPSVEVHIGDNYKIYNLTFYVGMTEYDYEIDAATGKILSNSVNDYTENLK